MAPFFWLSFKAYIKRINFWILVGVCCALIVLAYFYDLFGLGEPSTLFAETYAAVALLYVLVAPLFCAADVLEWEVQSGAAGLMRIRPAGIIATVAGRTAGIVAGTAAGLLILVAVFHITALLGKAYVPSATYAVPAVCVMAALTSSSLVYILAPRLGFIATAAAIFAIFSTANIIPASSTSQTTRLLIGLLPNFHLTNLQAMIATGITPPAGFLLFCLLHHLLYALFLSTVSALLLGRLHKPAKER